VSLSIGGVEVKPGTRGRGYIRVSEASTHEVRVPWVAFNGFFPGSTLCVIGGVHSLECTPIEGLLRIIEELDPSTLMGRLIIVPVVNTTGFNERTPYDNPWDHLNQNRVWPGDPEGPLTKKVAHAVWAEFLSKADAVVDAHSADLGEDATRSAFIFKTSNEELRSRMLEMAGCWDIDYVETVMVAGNTGEVVPRLGVPCVMTEAGAPYPVREKDAWWFAKGVYNLLRHLGILPGDSTVRKVPVDPESCRLYAKHGGAWRKLVDIGGKVKDGQLLGNVYSLIGENLQDVKAPYDGTVTFLRTHFSVNEGDTLLWLTRV
jgi:predicted deacylase